MQVFAIYDAKAGFYSAPMLARSKGEMVRMFMDSAHDTGSKIAAYPEDFRLYHIGSYDEETGMISQDSPFEDLGSGLQMQTVRRNMVRVDTGSKVAEVLEEIVECAPETVGAATIASWQEAAGAVLAANGEEKLDDGLAYIERISGGQGHG